MNVIQLPKPIRVQDLQSKPRRKVENEDDRMVQKIIADKLGKETQKADQSEENSPHIDRVTSSADPGATDSPLAAQDQVIEMTETQFASVLGGAVDRVSAEYTQKLSAAEALLVAQKADAEKKEKELKAQIEKQQALASVLQRHNVSLSAISGVTPQQAAISMSENRGGIHRDDAQKELQRIYDTTPTYEVATDYGIFQQMDNREMEAFILDNRKVSLQGLEVSAKKAGMCMDG